MSVNKKAYFQGGGGVEPTPGQKKYKSDPALVVQPRFKEPFYRNYDLYTIPGMEEVGPGTGWHGLQNYKSVQDFLKDRRKRLQPRYVADDSWQIDSGERVKQELQFGLANAGRDLEDTIRQAAQRGMIPGRKSLPASSCGSTASTSSASKTTQGMMLGESASTGIPNAATRALVEAVFRSEPTRCRTACRPEFIPSTMHYAACHCRRRDRGKPKPVMKMMRATPIDDFFSHNGHIRADGVMVHDMSVFQVKTLAELHYAWDYLKLVATIPGKEAFAPLDQSKCPLVRP